MFILILDVQVWDSQLLGASTLRLYYTKEGLSEIEPSMHPLKVQLVSTLCRPRVVSIMPADVFTGASAGMMLIFI